VFSLTPTKPLVAGEGGLVTTHRADIAEAVRLGRDYANPGDYDSRFVGLNARMSELHAALALESLVRFEEHLSRRAALAVRYRAALATIPGIHTQVLGDGEVTTNKDFTIAIDPDVFGLDRDALVLALRADGIDTRNYFSPPVHRQQAYRAIAGPALPVTDLTASRVVSLPMWGDLPADAVDAVCEVIAAVHARAAEIKDQAA
jgi:dTDP-4-amino-4,6-dideoxygalactose transaminase